MSSGITAVLFDIDDTLVDFAGAAHQALVHAVHRHLGRLPEADIAAAWAEVAELHYARYTNGELGFAEMLEARTAAFITTLGPPLAPDGVHVLIENERTTRIFDHYRVFDDVLPELDRLRSAGVRLGAVSNSDGDYQRRKLATVGLADAFTATVFSGDVGVAKPDPAIFRAAVAALETDPAGAVYVGDRWDVDVLGARGAGLAAVWLDRRGPGVPERAPVGSGANDGPAAKPADSGIIRISTLVDLAGALEQLGRRPPGR